MCASTVQDASDEFNAIHSTKAKNMLEDFYIGELDVDATHPEGLPQTTACMHITAHGKYQLEFPLAVRE